MAETLKKIPQTPEELGKLVQYIKKIHQEESIRAEKLNHATQRFAFLDEFHFDITNEEITERYACLQVPVKLDLIIEETERSITVVKTKMESELKMQRIDLDKEALQITENLTKFRNTYNDIEMAVEAADEINIMEKKFSSYEN